MKIRYTDENHALDLFEDHEKWIKEKGNVQEMMYGMHSQSEPDFWDVIISERSVKLVAIWGDFKQVTRVVKRG